MFDVPFLRNYCSQRFPTALKGENGEYVQRSQEDTKDRMEKVQEDMRNTLEKKIDSVEEKIALKVEEKIVVVEEKMEKKVEEKIEMIREELAGKFSLMSHESGRY
ncbi:hypothetical protein TNCV_1931341 [Trichonephila clavipes]|nr:hypothetical protein TNCV_1931341 [Trichonephila clavipes]